MEAKKLLPPELPPFLPHGWKKEVARTLGVHPNTVSRALRSRKGLIYMKIVRTAAAKYGENRISDDDTGERFSKGIL